MSELARIERIYGSVAEWQRCQMEDDERAWEREERNRKWYSDNEKLMDQTQKDGKLVMHFADACCHCPHYKSVGPTSEYDDVEHGICNATCNEDCPCHNYESEGISKREYELLPSDGYKLVWNYFDSETGSMGKDIRFFKTIREAKKFIGRHAIIMKNYDDDDDDLPF